MSVPSCPTARSLLPPHVTERRALQILQRELDLTEAESQIVYLLPLGLTVKQLACRTNRAPSTVKGHLEHIARKTKTSNGRELASPVTAVLWWAASRSGE